MRMRRSPRLLCHTHMAASAAQPSCFGRLPYAGTSKGDRLWQVASGAGYAQQGSTGSQKAALIVCVSASQGETLQCAHMTGSACLLTCGRCHSAGVSGDQGRPAGPRLLAVTVTETGAVQQDAEQCQKRHCQAWRYGVCGRGHTRTRLLRILHCRDCQQIHKIPSAPRRLGHAGPCCTSR